MTTVKVTKLKGLNILIIKQEGGRDFFLSSDNHIAISISSLSFLLKFLIQNGYMSAKVLEGILAELEE